MLKKIKNNIAWLFFIIALFLFGKKKSGTKDRIIDWKKVVQIWHKHMGNVPIKLLDETYYIPTKKEVDKFLELDDTNLKKYKKDIFDCDNFAEVLCARAALFTNFHLIYAESKTHAYNYVITKDNGEFSLWLIEPQTDKIVPASEAKNIDRYKTTYAKYS